MSLRNHACKESIQKGRGMHTLEQREDVCKEVVELCFVGEHQDTMLKYKP